MLYCRRWHEDIERQFAPGIRVSHAGQNVTHVTGHARDCQETRVSIQNLIKIATRKLFLLNQVGLEWTPILRQPDNA